jgi:hypothetical protein
MYEGELGSKAERLRRMQRAGLPVPDAYVLTHDSLSALSEEQLLSEVALLFSRVFGRRTPVVVRSSATDEDTALAAAPGVYDSYLDRRTPQEVVQAIALVQQGVRSADAVAYRRMRPAAAAESARMHVVVQRMMPCSQSGVLYSQDPTSDEPVMLVEATSGLGTPIVAGLGAEETFRLRRDVVDARPMRAWDTAFSPLDVLLARLGRVLEKEFGHPQDIEWGICGGRLYVFQSRDIIESSAVLLPVRRRPCLPSSGAPVVPLSRGYAVGTMVTDSGRTARPGEIVVLESMPTASTLERLQHAAGLLVRRGNALSHSAALCRELRLPAAVSPTPEDGRTEDVVVLLDAVGGTLLPLHQLSADTLALAVFAAFRHAALRGAPGHTVGESYRTVLCDPHHRNQVLRYVASREPLTMSRPQRIERYAPAGARYRCAVLVEAGAGLSSLSWSDPFPADARYCCVETVRLDVASVGKGRELLVRLGHVPLPHLQPGPLPAVLAMDGVRVRLGPEVVGSPELAALPGHSGPSGSGEGDEHRACLVIEGPTSSGVGRFLAACDVPLGPWSPSDHDIECALQPIE